jgi:YVTN family beta-propeller protein
MRQLIAAVLAGSTLALAPAAVLAASKVVWPDVVVQLHGSGKAYIVDTRTDEITATLDTCKGGTLGTTTPDGKKVYVSCAADGQKEMVVIDLGKKAVSARLETGNRPKHGVVSPDGKLVGINHWGLDGGKLRVTFMDTATDKVVKNIELEVKDPTAKGLPSMHNAWSVDGKQFFTVDRNSNKLVAINMKDWSVTSVDVDSTPHYPVPSPDGKELWLIVEGTDKAKPGEVVYDSGKHEPGIEVFDLTKPGLKRITRMDMPLIGEEVVEAHHGNFTQDGKLFLALNRGPGKDLRGREVAFFDPKTKALVHRLTTGSNGIGHTYNSPDGKLALVTNYGNNVLSIVDIAKRAVVKDVRIGGGRMGHVAFTKDGKSAYVSNDKDGALYKLDMGTFKVAKKINTNGNPGGGQVLNVWTNVFEELPR